jgi:general secretion pathway protein L
MSVLVVQIPARPRHLSRASADSPPNRPFSQDGTYRFALSADGVNLSDHGQRQLTDLPRADTVLAVMQDADVSWHPVTLPKVAQAKLRPLLIGSLEEALLGEAEQTHFAIQHGWQGNQAAWVATCHEAWLSHHLNRLEAANLAIERVVPAIFPGEGITGHFWLQADGPDAQSTTLMLSWSDPRMAVCLPADGGVARALATAQDASLVRWSADPEAAQQAEQWLGRPVESLLPVQRLLESSRSDWNLRQFSLARSGRGVLALRDGWRVLMSPPWRATRWGLVTLAVVQLIGLNWWAASLNAQVKANKLVAVKVAQETFPQMGAILDAPLQMNREMKRLRAQAGRVGADDLESALLVAASAWPMDRPPVERFVFDNGQLTLSTPGWEPAQVDQFRERIRQQGWDLRASEGELLMSRQGAIATGVSQ